MLSRSPIGLLVWKGVEEKQDAEIQPPGSRLKTPASPIWVICGDGVCVGKFFGSVNMRVYYILLIVVKLFSD